MSARAVFVLSLCVTGILAGCASAPTAPQQTWRDVARDCYAAVDAGRPPTYEGRRGVAACDRYVENQRYEETRRDYEETRRETQQREAWDNYMRGPCGMLFGPPCPEVRCYSTVIGNQIQTQCR